MADDDDDDTLAAEAQQRTFDHAMELWVQPEIERRRGRGLIHDVFELTAAQVIMREGEPIEVRLNDEVISVARMKLLKDVKAGDAVNLADVEGIKELVLTDADADAAHLTMVRFADGWTLAFDFRYNATTARRVMDIAGDFLGTALAARDGSRLRSATDALYSAVELMATAELLLLPVEKSSRDGRFKHHFIQMVLNKRGKAGLMSTSAASAAALNRLTNLRHAARYQLGRFDAADLPELFAHTEQRYKQMLESLPERVTVDPALLSSKPKPPPRG